MHGLSYSEICSAVPGLKRDRGQGEPGSGRRGRASVSWIWVTILLVIQDVFLDSVKEFITCCLLSIPANTLGKEAKGNLCSNEKIVSLTQCHLHKE